MMTNGALDLVCTLHGWFKNIHFIFISFFIFLLYFILYFICILFAFYLYFICILYYIILFYLYLYFILFCFILFHFILFVFFTLFNLISFHFIILNFIFIFIFFPSHVQFQLRKLENNKFSRSGSLHKSLDVVIVVCYCELDFANPGHASPDYHSRLFVQTNLFFPDVLR